MIWVIVKSLVAASQGNRTWVVILEMHFCSFVSSTAWGGVVGMGTETRLKQVDMFTETPGALGNKEDKQTRLCKECIVIVCVF